MKQEKDLRLVSAIRLFSSAEEERKRRRRKSYGTNSRVESTMDSPIESTMDPNDESASSRERAVTFEVEANIESMKEPMEVKDSESSSKEIED